MALIKDTAGRTDNNSAYNRLFGDDVIGNLFSKVHATTIRAGNELEDIVAEKIPNTFYVGSLSNIVRPFVEKSVVFKPSVGDHQPDFVIYDQLTDSFVVVELKAGDTFDTKKSDGEYNTLIHSAAILSARFNKVVNFALVGFNTNDRRKLVTGLKGRFTFDQVMTGIEFADYLHFNLSDVLAVLAEHQKQNRTFLLDAMKDIINAE